MPMQGIDIASWQAGINLRTVPHDFAIIKATGGTAYVNPYCDGWIQEEIAMGKCWGFYHFAREEGCRGTATEEADFFINSCKGYFGQGIPVLDFEFEAINHGPSWAKAFLDRVYEKTGVRPWIYMSKSVCRQFDWSSVSDHYGLWYAQYPNYNRTGYQDDPWTDGNGIGSWSFAACFQYTSSGLLPSWSGSLDLNIFYGDQHAWQSYVGKQGEEIPRPPVVDPTTPEPEPQPVPSFDHQLASNWAVAYDVALDKWGKGDERKRLLEDAGYVYDVIQDLVDDIYSDPNKLAGMVLADAFGSGEERREKLGDMYDEVMAIVNKSQGV